tara:strand:- start:17789 stop:17899 length:111 start_codon:yes stop_codon:yes gene_type:complete
MNDMNINQLKKLGELGLEASKVASRKLMGFLMRNSK